MSITIRGVQFELRLVAIADPKGTYRIEKASPSHDRGRFASIVL